MPRGSTAGKGRAANQARGGRGVREGEGEVRTTRWLEGGEEVHSLSFGTMLRGSTEGGNKQKNYIHR